MYVICQDKQYTHICWSVLEGTYNEHNVFTVERFIYLDPSISKPTTTQIKQFYTHLNNYIFLNDFSDVIQFMSKMFTNSNVLKEILTSV